MRSGREKGENLENISGTARFPRVDPFMVRVYVTGADLALRPRAT